MNGFEFDDAKSLKNKDKHGIDFVQAQVIWDDPELIEIRAKTDAETRYLIIGCIKNKHWSAVITYRKNNIRIISVRRSRKLEVQIYEN